jgi:lipopolysaccharide export system permease protein
MPRRLRWPRTRGSLCALEARQIGICRARKVFRWLPLAGVVFGFCLGGLYGSHFGSHKGHGLGDLQYLFLGAALGGLTGVIWVTQALKDFDLLTSKGQSMLIFFSATGLIIPSLVMIIAPIALFAAILFTLNKLNSDSELIVMSAAGLSPGRLLRPFAILMVVVALLVGTMSLWIMPSSFALLRNLLSQIRSDFLSRVVREGQFTTLDQGFVFHYRERGPGGALRGIFMQDRRDPTRTNTYIAESGLTISNDKDNYLILEKGSMQRQTTTNRDPIIVVFERYAIDLSQFGESSEGAPLKPRERSTRALLEPNLAEPYTRANLGQMRSELHDRLVNPLYALAFGMIAFAALAQARTTRQGRGIAILGAVLMLIAVRGLGFGVAALAARHDWAVAALYLFPLATMGAAGAYAFGLLSPLTRIKRPAPRGGLTAAG